MSFRVISDFCSRQHIPAFQCGGFPQIYAMSTFAASNLNAFNSTMQLFSSFDTRAQERQMIDNIMTGKGQYAPTPQNGNNPNATPASTKNVSEYFNKLTNENGEPTEKMQRLVQIEKEIKELEEKQQKAADNAEKNNIAAQIKQLQAEYGRIEREIGSTRASANLGPAYKFYSNLDKEELRQIHEKNKEISTSKSEIDAKKAQLQKTKKALLDNLAKLQYNVSSFKAGTPFPKDAIAKIAEDLSKNGKSLSPADTEALEEIIRLQDEIADLEKQVSGQITELTKNVQTAGSNTETTYFNLESQKRERTESERKQSSEETRQRSAQTTLAAEVVKAMAGKTTAKERAEAARKVILNKNPKDYGFVKKEEMENAVNNFAELFEENGSISKLLERYAPKLDASSDEENSQNQEANARELAFIEKMYDALPAGENGKITFKQAFLNEKTQENSNNVNASGYDILAATDARNIDSLKNTLDLISADGSVGKNAKQLSTQSLQAVKELIETDKNLTKDKLTKYKTLIARYEKQCGADATLKEAYTSVMEALETKIAGLNTPPSEKKENNSGSPTVAGVPGGSGVPSNNVTEAEAKKYIEDNFTNENCYKQRFGIDDFPVLTDKELLARYNQMTSWKADYTRNNITDYGLLWALSLNDNTLVENFAKKDMSSFVDLTNALNDYAKNTGVAKRLCVNGDKIEFRVPDKNWKEITADSKLDGQTIYKAMGNDSAKVKALYKTVALDILKKMPKATVAGLQEQNCAALRRGLKYEKENGNYKDNYSGLSEYLIDLASSSNKIDKFSDQSQEISDAALVYVIAKNGTANDGVVENGLCHGSNDKTNLKRLCKRMNRIAGDVGVDYRLCVNNGKLVCVKLTNGAVPEGHTLADDCGEDALMAATVDWVSNYFDDAPSDETNAGIFLANEICKKAKLYDVWQ